MAVYNELQVGRYVRFIQKLFSMKGRAPAPLTYTGEIASHIQLFSGVENRILENWFLYGVGFPISAGGAGNISVGRIRNPPGSNVVAVIERLLLSCQTNDQLALSYGASAAQQNDLATLQTPVSLDARIPAQQSVLKVSSKNNSATTLTEQIIFQIPILAFNVLDFIESKELPLLPGAHYDFAAATANETIGCGIIWRERALEDSEQHV